MENNRIKISCLEVTQPISTFYIGKIDWKDLLKIARNDIMRIRQEGEGAIDGYFGIQRELSKNRLKEISEYVGFSDATFPNSIVLSIDSITYDEKTNEVTQNVLGFKDNILEIKDDAKIAKIIDGQHRVFGLQKYVEDNGLFGEGLKFELIVTIFIDIDEEYQANIFSTINKAQTKVNNSLVYDLYSLSKSRSPQRTVHNIIKLLNEKENSPFYHLIKRLGIAEFQQETIAQATFADSIIRYISANPAKDRNDLRKGIQLREVTGKEKERYFFRNWFINKEDEVKIAKTIWYYFEAIKEKWPKAWGNSSFILTKSTGIIALMRFLKDIVSIYGEDKFLSKEDYIQILQEIKIDDNRLINDNYKSGGVGQSDLYKDLCSYILNQENDNLHSVTICRDKHRYDPKFEKLNDSQEFYMEGRRHQCSGCAYDQGLKDAKEAKEKNFRVEELNISQAGSVRHKDPKQAYDWGYDEGLKEIKNTLQT